jgi:hypothetical protein
MSKYFDIKTGLLASLTLGLAPFNPPHIVGKIQWVMGGAVGMKSMDWFDLFFHGLPWIYLIISVIVYFKTKKSTS